VISNIIAIAGKYGHVLKNSTDRELTKFVLDLNAETLFYDLDDAGSRLEISKWIRTTEQQATSTSDGLWAKCMGFRGRLMHNFFFHHNRFKAPWKRRILSKVYIRSMRGTQNMAWINGKFETRDQWINAGMMLQEMWLELTKHNVHLHPFGSVITNSIAHKKFTNKIVQSENVDALWFLFRMGYSEEPVRSHRLSVNQIMSIPI
jgi:hypothetical protein